MVARLAWIVVLGTGIGGGLGLLADAIVPAEPLARGLLIGERLYVPTQGTPAAWLERRRAAALERAVHFYAEGQLFDASLGDVGVALDVRTTLLEAAEVGHRGSAVRRLRDSVDARRGRVERPLTWSFDRARARQFFEQLAPSLARAPVDARLDLRARTKIPDVPGLELDVEASLDRLAKGSHEDEETIELAMRPVKAAVALADLTRVDVGKIVSAHETTFSLMGSGLGRSQNIRRAAEKIDGLVIAPGELFSFNAHVGARTLQNGFTWAPEIQGDEMRTGVGGGTCQVSTTLHIAALFGALEIVERQGHSHPSAYALMGLDATVSWPTVDLKLRNTLPHPVLIHAYLPTPTSIRVELLGGAPVATASYQFSIGTTADFTRRIYVKDFLPPGTTLRKQRGTRGYSVSSTAILRFAGGRVEEKRYFTGYRPSPEVLWVGPGTPDDALPPLPKHAKGVEGRMSAEVETYSM
jgi:vancomycin resistance protein YoaR